MEEQYPTAKSFVQGSAALDALEAALSALAAEYANSGMSAYVRLQEREFELTDTGYSAVRHQRFVGTGYFDAVQTTVAGGRTSTEALEDSTETEQFRLASEGAEEAVA